MIVQKRVCSATQRPTAENSPLAVASWWNSKLDTYVNDKVRKLKDIECLLNRHSITVYLINTPSDAVSFVVVTEE